MTDETRAIVPTGDAGITLGQQQIDASDIVPPRIKVVQQMSQEAQGGKAALAEPGDFFNTLTRENYGPSLTFIPIITFKQRVFLLRPERRERADSALASAGIAELSEGDGLKCRSFDMVQGLGEPGIECFDCPLSKWEGNSPPICTETYNVAALTELGDVVILSFAKSGAKTGKRMFSMVRLTAGAPWAKLYKATTREEKNNLGTFYVPDVALVPGDTPPPELLKQAQFWAREFGSRRAIEVTPDEEELPEPTTADF